jgi:serine/threonine protein kinase
MKNKKNIKINTNTAKITKRIKRTKRTKRIKVIKVIKGTKRIVIRKKKKNINSIYDGGAAFTKGGFGCLFKPALNCKNSELNMPPNYVSKLIEANHGRREYTYIYNIKKRLQHLPANVRKYFLLDNISMCEPKPLSEEDKVKIEEVCDYILSDRKDKTTNEPITSQNINNNLDKFKIINMPGLSISLSNYIRKRVFTHIDLVKLNNSIIEYLTIVIPALYKNGVVHGDIKPDNLMFNASDNNTLVLIDWGLSYIADSDRKNVPDALYRLGVQWHHPFSSFLFKKDVIDKYDNFLKKIKKEGKAVTKDELRVFAMSEYKNFMSTHDKQFIFLNDSMMIVYGPGLIKTLKLVEHDDVDRAISNMTITYIVEYIVDVLMTYTINYNLELGRYFNEVYLINSDMWGIMSTYSELIENIHLMDKISESERKIITDQMMYILIENLFKNGGKVINVPKLVNDIKHLNKYLMSVNDKGSRIETVGKNISSSMSARGNMGIVNKGLIENKAVFDKLDKYSNKLRGYSKERQLIPQAGVVRGGYKTRKIGKHRNKRSN